MTSDTQQKFNEYLEFCSYHVNPPMFETWLEEQMNTQKLLEEGERYRSPSE